MNIVVMKDGDCPNCEGCGYVDDGDGAPWRAWAELPIQSAAAVTMGLVKPVKCPKCDGTGNEDEVSEDEVSEGK